MDAGERVFSECLVDAVQQRAQADRLESRDVDGSVIVAQSVAPGRRQEINFIHHVQASPPVGLLLFAHPLRPGTLRGVTDNIHAHDTMHTARQYSPSLLAHASLRST